MNSHSAHNYDGVNGNLSLEIIVTAGISC